MHLYPSKMGSLQRCIILAIVAPVVAAPITLHKISDGECLEIAIEQTDATAASSFAGVSAGSCSSKGFSQQHGTKTLTLPFVGEVVCKRMSKPIAKASALKADAWFPLAKFLFAGGGFFTNKQPKAKETMDKPSVDDSWDQWDATEQLQEQLGKVGIKIEPDSPIGKALSRSKARPDILVTPDTFRVGMYKLVGDDCMEVRVPLLLKPAAMDLGGFEEGSCRSQGFAEPGSTERQSIAGIPTPVNVRTFTRPSADPESPQDNGDESLTPAPQQAQLPWEDNVDLLGLDKFRVSLYKIDGDECLEIRVDPLSKATATAVAKFDEGTCASLGYTVFGETTTGIIPPLPKSIPIAAFTNPLITPDPSKARSERKRIAKRRKGAQKVRRRRFEKLTDKYRITMYKISADGLYCSEARVDFAFFPAAVRSGRFQQGSCVNQGFTVRSEAKKKWIRGVPLPMSVRAFTKEDPTKHAEKLRTDKAGSAPSFDLYGPAEAASKAAAIDEVDDLKTVPQREANVYAAAAAVAKARAAAEATEFELYSSPQAASQAAAIDEVDDLKTVPQREANVNAAAAAVAQARAAATEAKAEAKAAKAEAKAEAKAAKAEAKAEAKAAKAEAKAEAKVASKAEAERKGKLSSRFELYGPPGATSQPRAFRESSASFGGDVIV